jgi:hypothetical protein
MSINKLGAEDQPKYIQSHFKLILLSIIRAWRTYTRIFEKKNRNSKKKNLNNKILILILIISIQSMHACSPKESRDSWHEDEKKSINQKRRPQVPRFNSRLQQ